MTDVWYENPEILLNNLNQFIPNKKLSKIENINSIARLAIYLAIILSLFKIDNRILIFPLLILFISYQLNKTSKFFNNKSQVVRGKIEPELYVPIVFKTSIENPYMNYITNNNTENNPNSFPQLLPNNLSINSDLNTSLNTFVKNDSVNTLPPLTPKIISKTPAPYNTQGSIPLINPTQPNTQLINQDNIELINQDIQPLINQDTQPLINENNQINYDLCITSNNNKSCLPENKIIDNPYNLSDNFKDKQLKKEIRKNYNTHLKFDPNDMWGKLINDRNYYTSPNIELVNDQSGFAEWCYTNNGNSGKCKTDGNNCVKDRDVRYHKGRISTNN
jgi:hypothetical protein